jgi:hypothetical protein
LGKVFPIDHATTVRHHRPQSRDMDPPDKMGLHMASCDKTK